MEKLIEKQNHELMNVHKIIFIKKYDNIYRC